MSSDDTGATATTSEDTAPAATCPVMSHPQAATGSMANQHWWPDQLNLRPSARTHHRSIRWVRSSTTRRSSRAWTSQR